MLCSWKALVVDEAHRLKNIKSRLFVDLASVPRDFCLLQARRFKTVLKNYGHYPTRRTRCLPRVSIREFPLSSRGRVVCSMVNVLCIVYVPLGAVIDLILVNNATKETPNCHSCGLCNG